MLALVGGAVAVVVVTGSRTATPAAVAGSSPAPDGPGGAPTIAAPRDIEGFTSAPCSLLKDEQARELGYTRWSTRDAAAGGRECTFTVRDPLRSLTLSALDGDRGSAFTDTYRDGAAVFTPLEVDGLPAVVTQGFVGSQLCRITVGVADGRSLQADTYVPEDTNEVPITDPCARALRGVEAAVVNLPRGR